MSRVGEGLDWNKFYSLGTLYRLLNFEGVDWNLDGILYPLFGFF